MRTSFKILLVSTASVVAGLLPRVASAQMDVNPPLPNVLLLIDTSGSMELMADGNKPESESATCVPNTTTPMNRWATLVSVLTGSINNFSCSSSDRHSSAFKSEYSLSGVAPYDSNYYLPFHRILSNGCTPGPGTSQVNWSGWPAGAIKYHDYTNVNTVCPAPGAPGGFSQNSDGVLDSFAGRVRFGLMTFDSFSDPGTGATGAAPEPISGNAGMWSYYLGWNSGGAPASGNPANCTSSTFEVGARNPAAPPWEGRLQPFGPFDDPSVNVLATNAHIQEEILAMRPYGATPMAGMLQDARDFILNDTSTDPSTSKPFGPSADPFFTGGCRSTFIIILSDGAPNLDLRPACASGNGKCPYELPYQIASELATNSDPNKRVLTYTVGFGLSTSGPTDCTKLTTSDLTAAGGTCATTTNATLQACCTLGRIAFEGGTTNAYFANDTGSLKAAIATVLSKIAKGSTSRTIPVFSSASATASATTQGNATASSYQFGSSFNAPAASLWSGNLDRERSTCMTVSGQLQAVPQTVQASLGDDFGANVNSNDSAHPRKFWTVIGTTTGGGTINSTQSIRPGVTSTDGLGVYSGAVNSGGLVDGPTFSSTLATTPAAVGMNTATPPTDCSSVMLTPSATTCTTRLMRWEVGLDNLPTLIPSRNPASCPKDQICSVLGSIYHSTPVTVGVPTDFLRDESYSQFALAQTKRPLMLYTATTDGQLHGFKVAANDPADSDKVDHLENNEMWSFIPPDVLPRLLPTYNTQAFLLDGAPVVRDVVYQRTLTQSIAGGVGGATWNTVLLAGGGAGGPFYYALDITDPVNPKFLWQLSTDTAGNSLFGQQTATPAITTIPLLDSGQVSEVAVAILSGGSAPVLPGTCLRKQPLWPNVDTSGKYKPRSAVRCWGTAGGSVGPARSLTIVRLDTGKVLMNFRGATADGPPGLTSTNSMVVNFDSPITGIPVPYPSQPGLVTNRIYVGDADGTLWRVDVSDPTPANWKVDMAWDAYANGAAAAGQPIATPPVVSVDAVGNNVVLFSTGDQDQFSTPDTTMTTSVLSISDKPNATKFQTSLNWVKTFAGGQRVTGPISLFNSVAYFATFTPNPPGTPACTDGFGSIWGVDYFLNKGDTALSPVERLVPDVTQPTVVVDHLDQSQGVIVFGVAVTQVPTCSDTTNYNDSYLGSHTAVSNVSSTTFQLVFQTGKDPSSKPINGSATNGKTITLASPRQSTRIDSWASVVE